MTFAHRIHQKNHQKGNFDAFGMVFLVFGVKKCFVVHKPRLELRARSYYLGGVYFKSVIRTHPQTGRLTGYFRLVESYRNADDRVCHRTIVNVGYMEDTSVEQRNLIQKQLTALYENHGQHTLFNEEDPIVKRYVSELWADMIAKKRIDLEEPKRMARMINADTMEHTAGLEIGTERLCHDAWEKLQLSQLLRNQGWNNEDIQLACTQIISRAAYPASELETARWIQENSAICTLSGYDKESVTKDKLYQSALRLFDAKDAIDLHLSSRTNDLFDLRDRIILYDLTNTYFEGEKRSSRLARFGRSKEKRGDARLVVLALVVNIEGFIKYSSVLQGNIADCKTLSATIDKLAVHTMGHQAVVVMDAGIATDDNLKLILQKGYQYLCVARSKPKDYQINTDRLTVLMQTRNTENVTIKAVTVKDSSDYFIEVKSPSKQLKEDAMSAQFARRFEELLDKIANSLHKKGGVKKADKVHERIGRAKERYPSIHHCYDIEVQIDEKSGNAKQLTWKKDPTKNASKEAANGIYLIRTSLPIEDEVVIWNIYNTIRQIESTFRTLKTDLDLRPIYHKNDNATMAHLHLGLLAYWLVNTIRYQLKGHGINYGWKEIVRIGNTQKLVTTIGTNPYGQSIKTIKCTQPAEKLKQLTEILGLPPYIKRKKSVVHKMASQKNQTQQQRGLLSG